MEGRGLLSSVFNEGLKVKTYFGRLAGKDEPARTLPLGESQVMVDLSRIEPPCMASEDAREKIEALKIDRSASSFLKAFKHDPELWSMFLEYFSSEESFLNLIEKRRFASVLSGLMKAFIDHDMCQQQKNKEKRFKEEAEIVEKHKAYVLAKSNGFDLNPSAALKGKSSAIHHNNHQTSGKFKQSSNILDPHDAADKELIRTLVSPRSESHQYELVSETKRATETQYPSSSRVLPKYDLDRIKQMANQAESEAKASQTRTTKHSKLAVSSQKPFVEDFHAGRDRLEAARPEELPYRHSKEREFDSNADIQAQINNHRELSPSKLNIKRQEFKQKKSGQKSPSQSPETQKEGPASDNEKKMSFMEKMMNFDYSNLRKPRIENENQISSKLAKEALKRQKSREKKVEGLLSADEVNLSPEPQANRQGRFGHAYSDEEMRVNPKKRDDYLLEYSDNEEDPLGFASKTYPSKTGGQQRKSSPGYPPRSPDQQSVKSQGQPKSQSKGGDGGRQSLLSKDQKEGKKLTPLVSEAEKRDVYSKVQKQLNQKEKEQRAVYGSSDKQQEDRPRSESSGQRLPREHRHPQVDHKNPSYVPAHQREQKRFLAENDKPNYKEVKSSNYGKFDRSKVSPKPGSSSLPAGSKRSASPAFKDVRSLVDSILQESKIRVEPIHKERR